MHLSGIHLRHFRNLADQQLDLPAEGVAVVGENAQGKTNFLEAIYYLETFRSFRGSRDDRLVAFGEDYFRISGSLVGEGSGDRMEVAAAFQNRGRRKKITLNGDEPERLGDGLGRLAAVVFSPADVALVSDGPGVRRRFLDILLSLNEPGYLTALQRFRQVLNQRNAALKDGRSSGTVEVWNAGLIESGTQVMAARQRWAEAWKGEFSSYYSMVSGHLEGEFEYQPNVKFDGCETPEEIGAAFHDALTEAREREVRFRNTVVGPHRDDLNLRVVDGDVPRDLREFGSGGQRRTAALALRLVEAATVRRSRGQEPIILMDDVFAELDPGRSERVLSLMEKEETGQVFLTVPKEGDIRLRRDSLPRWRVRSGVLEW